MPTLQFPGLVTRPGPAAGRACIVMVVAALTGVLPPLFTVAATASPLPTSAPSAPPPAASSSGQKAAFLYRFGQFVTWPAAAFADERTRFCIGVLGPSPVSRWLSQTVAGKRLQGRDVFVQEFSEAKSARECHILFVSPDMTLPPRAVVAELAGASVLTVGEKPEFTRSGGMIRLLGGHGRLRFEINTGAASTEHLSISSRLLRLASIVTTEDADTEEAADDPVLP